MALGPVAQIHVSVADVDRAVEFYRDVLGIQFLFRVPGQPMAFFASVFTGFCPLIAISSLTAASSFF